MKILIVGAGPSGLMFASQMKKKKPDWKIDVVEKNNSDDVFGWGVVLPGKAKQHPANPLSYIDLPEALSPQYLDEFKLSKNDQSNHISTGITLCGVERKGLVKSLRSLCQSLGIDIKYNFPITNDIERYKRDYDLVVVSKGINHKVDFYSP